MSYLIIDRIGYYFFRRPLYAILERITSPKMPEPSDEFIDVIIPTVAKDLDTLPYCLDGIRRNVTNRIKGIYLVGPEDSRIIDFARLNNLHFVEERSVLGYGPKEVNFITNKGVNRSGWLFQQLLKLSGNIGECDNFVTIDSDHILIRPHVFITKEGKYVFYRSNEFHLQHFITNYKLFGKFRIPSLSYVAHKMVFNKKRLEIIKATIEERFNMPWSQVIINIMNKDDASPLSEFEIFAGSVEKKNKISMVWREQDLLRGDTIDITELANKYTDKLSVTFPEYLVK